MIEVKLRKTVLEYREQHKIVFTLENDPPEKLNNHEYLVNNYRFSFCSKRPPFFDGKKFWFRLNFNQDNSWIVDDNMLYENGCQTAEELFVSLKKCVGVMNVKVYGHELLSNKKKEPETQEQFFVVFKRKDQTAYCIERITNIERLNSYIEMQEPLCDQIDVIQGDLICYDRKVEYTFEKKIFS